VRLLPASAALHSDANILTVWLTPLSLSLLLLLLLSV
jgi:hypothetical protein